MVDKLSEDLNIIQNSDIEVQIDPITSDLNIIQKLDDEPNDVGGLSAQELKAKFDEGGNTIKTYINESLIPQLKVETISEEQREINEQRRQDNESQRQANEQVRQDNETARVEAETARNVWEDYDPAKAYVPGNKVYWAGSSYVNKSPCTSVAPNITKNWQMVAKRGETVGDGMTEEDADGRYLQLSGGSLSGPLTVQEPTQAANPVTKGYLEQNVVRPQILVTTEAGAAVTCSKGTVTFQKTATGGTAVFNVTDFGDWTLSAEKDGEQADPATVSVETVKQYPVTLTFAPPAPVYHICGVSWDGTSTTKLSRTDDAALFTDPVPAVGNGGGSSPFDSIMPWSGMTRVTQDGNELVAIPKYWVKVQSSPFRVQISNQPADGFQVSPAHRDRGDGQGERDVVYIGRYECDSSYKSTSGQAQKTGITFSTFRNGIHGLGAEYWQADYALQLTLWFLYIVEYADWDAQSVIGLGNVNSSKPINTGATDSMTYHTGRAAGTDGQTSIQYRWIENIWGNLYEKRDGLVFSAQNICTYNNPADFSDTYGGPGAQYRNNKLPKLSTGQFYVRITGWALDKDDPSFITPAAVGGSANTYVPDGYVFSGDDTRYCLLRVSGSYGSIDYAGLFYLLFNDSKTSDGSEDTSRIQKLPNAA